MLITKLQIAAASRLSSAQILETGGSRECTKTSGWSLAEGPSKSCSVVHETKRTKLSIKQPAPYSDLPNVQAISATLSFSQQSYQLIWHKKPLLIIQMFGLERGFI